MSLRSKSVGRRPAEKLHVLVVDDSAVVRQFMGELLGKQPDMTVAVAGDPLIARRKMSERAPDVLVLDLELPRMDGLTFLRQLMAETPLPVVICSGHVGRGSDSALRALEEGAVELIAKPRIGLREFLRESSLLLLDSIRAAARARIVPRRGRRNRAQRSLGTDSARPPRVPSALARPGAVEAVAIGASTGGIEALRQILSTLPNDTPGLVIVQHMPEGFTKPFSERLNQRCGLEVKEASSGDRVLPGRALIAAGGRHLIVERHDGVLAVEVIAGPLVRRHRPSVDVLLRSVARACGRRAVGVILTGMGDDGVQGLLEMRRAGAATIAEDESSCTVFGMPKEAIRAGAAEVVRPLSRIPGTILNRVRDRE